MSQKPGPKMKDPSHEEVLQFVREQRRPFVTTQEVAKEFDNVSRRTINARLNDLHQENKLKKREMGAGSVVWYVEET